MLKTDKMKENIKLIYIHNKYSETNITRVMQLKTIRLAWNMSNMGKWMLINF